MHAHFKFVSTATQAVWSHVPAWQEKALTPIHHLIYTLKWQRLGKNKTAEKQSLLDREIRWFWHIIAEICTIRPLTSVARLWGYRKGAAKYLSARGKMSSRADQASAPLCEPMLRDRWVLSRCHCLAGQQCHLLGCWNLCLPWDSELHTNCFLTPMWISPVLSTASPRLTFLDLYYVIFSTLWESCTCNNRGILH